MPKLNKSQAKTVANAEAASGSYLLPEGRYAARLRSVTEKKADGGEYPYWVWEFEALHNEEGERVPGRQWNNTSLSPKSAGFLKATFEAFGFTSDSDTDEIVGEWVVLNLIQEVQTKGANAGAKRNAVSSLGEFDPADWDFDPEDIASGPAKNSEPDF